MGHLKKLAKTSSLYSLCSPSNGLQLKLVLTEITVQTQLTDYSELILVEFHKTCQDLVGVIFYTKIKRKLFMMIKIFGIIRFLSQLSLLILLIVFYFITVMCKNNL